MNIDEYPVGICVRYKYCHWFEICYYNTSKVNLARVVSSFSHWCKWDVNLIVGRTYLTICTTYYAQCLIQMQERTNTTHISPWSRWVYTPYVWCPLLQGVSHIIFGSRVQHEKKKWTQLDLRFWENEGSKDLKSMKRRSIGLKIKEKIDTKCLKSLK